MPQVVGFDRQVSCVDEPTEILITAPKGSNMANKTVGEITIDARAAQVLEVIADIDSYADWVKGMSQSAVTQAGAEDRPAEAQFSVSASGVEDSYVLRYDWSQVDAPTQAVSWSLVRAKKITQLDGQYELNDLGNGQTKVTYSLAFSVKIPMFSMMKTKAEKALTEAALKDLKAETERRVGA